MNTYVKRTALLCLFAVLLALLLLAVSLSDFRPQQGAPIPGAVELGNPLQATIPSRATAPVPFPLPGMIMGILLDRVVGLHAGATRRVSRCPQDAVARAWCCFANRPRKHTAARCARSGNTSGTGHTPSRIRALT